jgi:hypothetical protein
LLFLVFHKISYYIRPPYALFKEFLVVSNKLLGCLPAVRTTFITWITVAYMGHFAARVAPKRANRKFPVE